MKLNRTIAYAVHAVMRLACSEEGVPISCSRLAREGGLPDRFLLQVLRHLVNCGVLRSARGVNGGYYLARPASQISVWDIVEGFENPLEPSLAAIEGMAFETRTIILATLRQASQAARVELQKLMIADLSTDCRQMNSLYGASADERRTRPDSDWNCG